MATTKQDNSQTLLAAVLEATEKQTAAIMESVAVQQQILQAVLNIRIGDEAIARAVERYERKMAVVRGGRR